MKNLSTYSVIVLLAALADPCLADPGDPEQPFRGGGNGIVFDHPRVGLIAPSSDTDIVNMFGEQVWQRLADDVVLPISTAISRVTWWGAYNLDNAPETETMRVRFYDARPGDGLPGNVLFEESFTSAIRSETGNLIATSVIAREFIYEANLSAPFTLDSNITFWLEIAQIGDVRSNFQMEQANGELTGFAFINDIVPDWEHSGPVFLADLAFQLSTIPEPSSLALFAVCFGVLATRRGRKGVRGSRI